MRGSRRPLGETREPLRRHLLVRPDGHVAYRREDTDLSGVVALLARWLTG